MPMYFDKIGKSVDKFLKQKEYKLDRRAEFEITSDNVTWKNKTILKDNAVESELKVSAKKGKETFGFETTTKPNTPPEFTVETSRFSNVFNNTKLKFKDPNAELELKRASGKLAMEVKGCVNTNASTMDTISSICYQASDSVHVGFEVKFEKYPVGQLGGPTAYSLGVQWQQNADRTIAAALKNTKKEQTGLLGVRYNNVYKNYTGYFQGAYAMSTGETELQFGASRPQGDNSLWRGVYRYGVGTGTNNVSIMFEHKMKENKVHAVAAMNVDMNKSSGSSLEYKLVFG